MSNTNNTASQNLNAPSNVPVSAVKGLHAIVEHAGAISHYDCAELEDLLSRAATAAGATILGANFHDFGSGMGNTGVLMLAESHMSVHTWPENNYAAIDIFVCSDTELSGAEPIDAAIEVLLSADTQGHFNTQIIHRSIPELPTLSIANSTIRTNINTKNKSERHIKTSVTSMCDINKESK